jgi:hypothetical protein
VTKGDFDGDRIDDYAVLLMPTDSKPPRLVVALRHNSSWRLTTLRDFPDVDRADLYIATLKPGRFTRTASADGPLEHGEVRAAQSKYQGIAAGISESSEIGFFFLNGRWKHIWIAD